MKPKYVTITVLTILAMATPLFGAGFKLPSLPSFTAPATNEPEAPAPQPATAPASGTNDVQYSDSNPPPMTLDETMAAAKNTLSSARDARALKAEVDKLLRAAAANVHVSAVVQSGILDGLNKYLGSLEKMAKVDLGGELQYSELEFRFNKAINTNAPIGDIKTVLTTDLQGSQVNADKIIQQLNACKSRRDAIQSQAEPYYELFTKSGAALDVVDRNYKNALVTGDVATEAVGKKLNELHAKAVGESATTVALIGALVYYENDVARKNNHRRSNNPLAMLGERAKLEASTVAIQSLSRDLQNTQKEFQDMKLYADQARGLLDEIHSHGPALRDQNQNITKVLSELSAVAKDSLQARAQTDKEIGQFVTDRDGQAKRLAEADKIAIFAE